MAPATKKIKVEKKGKVIAEPTAATAVTALPIKNVESAVYVFGSGDCGQLGLGEDVDMAPKPKLHPFFNDKHIIAIEAGGLHTLALSSDGQVYSWGCNDEKALGHGAEEFSVGKVEGLEGLRIIQIACGDSISAALTADGQVYTWGTFRDSKGVLGMDEKTQFQDRPQLLTSLNGKRVIQISAGSNHLTAVTEDDQIYTWGCGEQGQLGRRVLDRHKMEALKPTRVTPRRRRQQLKSKFAKVVCGSYHTLMLLEDGTTFAMGLNNFGQLGLGDHIDRFTAIQIDQEAWKGEKIIELGAGEHHSLALSASGKVFAFGRADSGQLGMGPLSERALPFPTLLNSPEELSSSKVSHISAGGNHNLAVTDKTHVFSWGYGEMHQLGHGAEKDELLPRKLLSAFPGEIMDISAGGQHSVVLVDKKSRVNGIN